MTTFQSSNMTWPTFVGAMLLEGAARMAAVHGPVLTMGTTLPRSTPTPANTYVNSAWLEPWSLFPLGTRGTTNLESPALAVPGESLQANPEP